MKNNIISFNDLGASGRIGNQMFQFSALVNIANVNKFNFMIQDPNNVSESKGEYVVNYFPEIKAISGLIFGKSNYKNLVDENSGFIVFDNDLLTLKENVNLIGYFQSLKYINIDKNLIKKIFTFNEKYQSLSKEILDEIRLDKEIVFIHVRRSDYLKKKMYHYPLSLKYYKKAIKKLEENYLFIVFSDDSNWCKRQKIFKKKNVKFIQDILQRYQFNLNRDILEMCLMSNCDGAIISNSSYSWWGAWLQKNPSNIISPDKKNWFGYLYNFDATDLIDSDWISIADNKFRFYLYKFTSMVMKFTFFRLKNY